MLFEIKHSSLAQTSTAALGAEPVAALSGHAPQRDNRQMPTPGLERDGEFQADAGLAFDERPWLGKR